MRYLFMMVAMLSLTTYHSATALPSLPQNWVAHKRALLQLQLDIATEPTPPDDGNSTAAPSITPLRTQPTTADGADPLYDHATDYHSALDAIMPVTKAAAEHRADSILKLLLANLDTSDVKTIALKFLPDYTKYCLTAFDCEELGAALRRLYLTRYRDLEQSIQRMDKLGYILHRIQFMVEHPGEPGHKHPHQHHRRRPGDWRHHPVGLRRIDLAANKKRPERMDEA